MKLENKTENVPDNIELGTKIKSIPNGENGIISTNKEYNLNLIEPSVRETLTK